MPHRSSNRAYSRTIIYCAEGVCGLAQMPSAHVTTLTSPRGDSLSEGIFSNPNKPYGDSLSKGVYGNPHKPYGQSLSQGIYGNPHKPYGQSLSQRVCSNPKESPCQNTCMRSETLGGACTTCTRGHSFCAAATSHASITECDPQPDHNAKETNARCMRTQLDHSRDQLQEAPNRADQQGCPQQARGVGAWHTLTLLQLQQELVPALSHRAEHKL